MGAGGSTQSEAMQRGQSATASTARVQSVKASMKKQAIDALATQFAIVPYSLHNGSALASKGVGAVTTGEDLQLNAMDGAMPLPPHLSAAAVATRALQNHGSNSNSNEVGGQYRWFVEDLDRLGHWEPYNRESSDRLESAFLQRAESCTVTLRKHAYTVDLLTMQQVSCLNGSSTNPPSSTAAAAAAAGAMAGGQQQQRIRRVQRAAAKVTRNATTSEEETVEMVAAGMADPFAEDDADAEQQQQYEQHAHSNAAASSLSSSPLAEKGNGVYPVLTHTVHPAKAPVYSLDVTPSQDRLSAEARAVLSNSSSSSDASSSSLPPMDVLSGGKDGRLIAWDATTGQVRTRYAITASQPVCVLVARYSPSAKFVVCGCDDNDARVYEIGVSSPLYILKGHTHKVYGVGVTADEQQVLTGSMDHCVRVWDLATGACLREEACHTAHVFSVTPSLSNPFFFLSAGNDAILCAHDTRSANSVVMRLKGHTATLWDSAIFPGEGGENRQLASAGMDDTVRLWDPRQPEGPLCVLKHHTRPVHSVNYTPNGQAVMSSSKDSYVFLSETQSGTALWRAKAQATSVFRVLYHPERQTLVTSGVSGLVGMWSWPAGKDW